MPEIHTIEDMLLPDAFRDEAHLEDFLSTPTRGLVNDFAELAGDILILGVAGKVGPTLAMMAKRAAPGKRVIGVARFSDADVKRRLEAAAVETITCDLLDREAVARLPTIPNVVTAPIPCLLDRQDPTCGSRPARGRGRRGCRGRRGSSEACGPSPRR